MSEGREFQKPDSGISMRDSKGTRVARVELPKARGSRVLNLTNVGDNNLKFDQEGED